MRVAHGGDVGLSPSSAPLRLHDSKDPPMTLFPVLRLSLVAFSLSLAAGCAATNDPADDVDPDSDSSEEALVTGTSEYTSLLLASCHLVETSEVTEERRCPGIGGYKLTRHLDVDGED